MKSPYLPLSRVASSGGGLSFRLALALFLRAASALLDGVAQRLAMAQARADAREAVLLRDSVEALIEFHAEAGAPEGALYVDGQFVGFVPGVSRL